MERSRHENIILAAIVLLSIFSGLFIQLLIYQMFNVRVSDVPILLIAVLWIGFSAVVSYIVWELEL